MENQLLKTGGTLSADTQTIVCKYSSPRLVLSTSLYNGGYLMADAVFNHRLSAFVDSEHDLPGGSMENYLEMVANEHGLNRKGSTGLLTSARMECRGYSVEVFEGITVEVVATAGVDENAARAGDPACYYEHNDGYQPLGGTINILAFTNISLPQGAMAKALVSITEAKTAVLQELAVVSPFTLNPATGTGTDGIILTCDPKSTLVCKDAGTQSKLGELFCRAVKTAVKQSLAQECKLKPWRQGTVPERMRRLDITADYESDLLMKSSQGKMLLAMSQSIWQEYCWGLIGNDELYLFFTLLESPSLQPLGAILSAALRQKRTAIVYKESINNLLGGAS